MSRPHARFSPLQRGLHWLMAAMIIAMLFIGVGMVSSLPRYAVLLKVHRPLGIAVLLLALCRLIVRGLKGAPPLPDDMPAWQALAAKASHVALYVLMIAMPLVGWGMLSAGGYPVRLWSGFSLPPIAPHDDGLHALLRTAHTGLAFLLFATILAHLAAALFHALARRDGVFSSMTGVGEV